MVKGKETGRGQREETAKREKQNCGIIVQKVTISKHRFFQFHLKHDKLMFVGNSLQEKNYDISLYFSG